MFAKTAHDTEKGKWLYARDNFQESTRGVELLTKDKHLSLKPLRLTLTNSNIIIVI